MPCYVPCLQRVTGGVYSVFHGMLRAVFTACYMACYGRCLQRVTYLVMPACTHPVTCNVSDVTVTYSMCVTNSCTANSSVASYGPFSYCMYRMLLFYKTFPNFIITFNTITKAPHFIVVVQYYASASSALYAEPISS